MKIKFRYSKNKSVIALTPCVMLYKCVDKAEIAAVWLNFGVQVTFDRKEARIWVR